MRALILGLFFGGIVSTSFSQTKTVNATEKSKEDSISTVTNRVNQAQGQSLSKKNVSRKIRPILKKEKYELAPKKE
ncbi:MAG: hypothetical protein ACKO6A_02805 [Bacteroidota bacterium]